MRRLATIKRYKKFKNWGIGISLDIGIWNLNIRRNTTAMAISTAGYCQEIDFLQYLHFPCNKTKLNTGIKSNQKS